MHVAGQLFVDQFKATLEGEPGPITAVFPEWSELDRFGIVVTEPLGGLGASLLTQLAIANFYEVEPGRRTDTPTYPEIYLFHVGGPHGDFSNFDFWPPRKEVLLPANEPLAVLEALNAYGITRLALPAGPDGDTEVFSHGLSTWAEVGAARERLRSSFVYSKSGTVPDADVALTSLSTRLFENIEATQDTMVPIRALRVREDAHARGEDVSVPNEDDLRWAKLVELRYAEVDHAARTEAQEQFTRSLEERGGHLRESYRRISADDALVRIAGL